MSDVFVGEKGPELQNISGAIPLGETKRFSGKGAISIERYHFLLENGLLTINEIRQVEGLPSIGSEGDKLFKPKG